LMLDEDHRQTSDREADAMRRREFGGGGGRRESWIVGNVRDAFEQRDKKGERGRNMARMRAAG
jgi:hypothetical protein